MGHLDLLIAAPADPKAHAGWGDVHFARGLQLGLQQLGVTSRLLYRDNHGKAPPPPPGSSLLVLRGKYAPPASWLARQTYACKALWLISWPLDPTPAELAAYDRLFVASTQDTPRIARLSGRPTSPLLQATGFWHVGRPEPASSGVLFVGNTRGVSRPIVRAFHQAGLPLELIGAGWEELGLQPEASSIANHQLPARYRRALAVLNDHHQAMADYGYLNNRVFDVLACAVPVITDVAPGCPPDLEAAVVRHPDGADPRASLEQARALRAQPLLLSRVARCVRQQHSFVARARQLLACLSPG
ncbi:MAG: glycosyltransferase family 1 protein [Cyanobacteria bacterium K_DeepCast_35m_m1_288]|nr:glycosyltransferase family 1 protein [Cyanobacteria bacterium K_DeepCast_35m_m1_288]